MEHCHYTINQHAALFKLLSDRKVCGTTATEAAKASTTSSSSTTAAANED
jgi:hypothetical protein